MSVLSLFINFMHFSWMKAQIFHSGMCVQLTSFYANWNMEACGSHWKASVVWFPLIWSVNKKILLRRDKTSKKHSHNPQIKPYTHMSSNIPYETGMSSERLLHSCSPYIIQISFSQILNSTDGSVLDSSHLKSVSSVPLALINRIII